MKIRCAILIGALCLATDALAEQGNWLVRVRAIDIRPDASSGPVPGVDVDDKWAPEVDISYFLTKNLALELILTYPQKHDVTLNGANIGTVKHLPPTLTLQYHFAPEAAFRPYVGAGINYTRFSSVNLNVPPRLDTESSSVAWALQAGFDVPVARNMVVNLDVKKVRIETNLFTPAGYLTTLKIDPLIVGVGIGWKF